MAFQKKTYDKKYLQRAIVCLAAIACIFRLFIFLQGRGFFFDEANLLRNIYDLSFLQLLGTLDHDQYAPLLYLWDLKLWSFLGINEYTMRITSLLAGVMSVYLLYEWGKKNLHAWGLFYLIGMLGFSYLMIRYSTEVKQYGVDVFITCLLMYALHVSEESGAWKSLYFLVAISVLFSMPSVFIIFGMGLYLMANRNSRRPGMIISIVSLLVFGFYYLTVLKEAASSTQLQVYHERYFLSLDVLANGRIGLGFFSNVFGKTAVPLILALVLSVWGLYRMFKIEKRQVLLFLAPFIGLCLASFLKQYSFIPRMTLFIFPLFWYLVAYGLEDLTNRLNGSPQHLLFHVSAFGFIILSIWTLSPFKSKHWPMQYEELGLVLSKAPFQDQDVLLMTTGAVPGFDVYNRIHSQAHTYQLQEFVKSTNQLNSTIDSLLQVHSSIFVLDAHTFGKEADLIENTIENSKHSVLWQSHATKAKLWKLGSFR